MPVLWVFEADVFIVQKGLFAIKNVDNRFFHNLFSQAITVPPPPHITWEYRMLQGVTGRYRGLQGVIGAYKELHGVKRGDRGFQGVTGSYKGL